MFNKYYQYIFPKQFRIFSNIQSQIQSKHWISILCHQIKDNINNIIYLNKDLIIFKEKNSFYKFIIRLSNGYFRLNNQIKKLSNNSYVKKRLEKLIKDLYELFNEYNVKIIIDIENKDYKRVSHYFKILGSEDNLFKYSYTVSLLQKPAIYINGILIQKAEGVCEKKYEKKRNKLSLKMIKLFFFKLYSKFYQSIFPKQFRINFSFSMINIDNEVELINELIILNQNLINSKLNHKIQNLINSPDNSISLPQSFIIEFGNLYFRILKNIKKLDLDQQKLFKRNIQRIDNLLKEYKIEILDMTSQIYDPGLINFEPKAKKEGKTNYPKIEECLIPAIYFKGELLQKAQGIVIVPK